MLLHFLLVKGVYLGDFPRAWVDTARKPVGSLQLVLRSAYSIGNRPWGEGFLLNSESLHTVADHTLFVIGIVDRKAVAKSNKLTVLSQNAHTYGMEGSCPHRRRNTGVVKGGENSVFYLVCSLVGEGDSQNTPRLGGLGNELRKDIVYLVNLKLNGTLKGGDSLGDNPLGCVLGKVCVTVFNKVSYAVYKNGSLAASSARKHQKRSTGGKDSPTLLGVESCSVYLVEKSPFCS